MSANAADEPAEFLRELAQRVASIEAAIRRV
jgi:hypothetical protein